MNWQIVCNIDDNKPKVVSLMLFDGNKTLVANEECEQCNFCEKITTMMDQLLILVKKANSYQKQIIYSNDFNVEKHITTERIFRSFCLGMQIIK